jgi:hypothetical protein
MNLKSEKTFYKITKRTCTILIWSWDFVVIVQYLLYCIVWINANS